MTSTLRRLPPALGLAALAVLGPGPAHAEPSSEPVGQQTRAWLDLQGRNAQPGRSHAVPGEVADRVYQRYVDSFRAPIGATAPARAGAARPSASPGAEAGTAPAASGR